MGVLTTIAGTEILLSTAATTAAGLVSAASALSSGAAQQKAGAVQAEMFNRQAKREREIGALNARRIGEESKRLAGRQRALLAGQGRDIGSGSALLLQTDLAESEEFEKQLAKAGGETQASTSEARAALARAEGRTPQRSSLFRAGSTLLKTGGEFAQSFG